VSLDDLGKSPYNLKDGGLIGIRVRATNSKGQGKFSPVNTVGALMVSKPAQIAIESLVRTSGSTATLAWTVPKSVVPTTTYTLYKEAENNKFYKLAGFESKEPKYLLDKLSPGEDYSFKLVGKNTCGSSPLSKAIKLSMPNIPNEMASVTKSRIGCEIKIEWKEPAVRGTPILSYLIEIRAQNGKFIPIPTCK